MGPEPVTSQRMRWLKLEVPRAAAITAAATADVTVVAVFDAEEDIADILCENLYEIDNGDIAI